MSEPRTGPAQPANRLRLLPRHRKMLLALLREHLPGVEVWAYGSRVNGQSHDGSDLDLVLRSPDLQEIPIGQVTDFEEALRESNIPFLVEARDWARLPESFHPEIEREYVVLVEKNDRDLAGEWKETVYGPMRSDLANSRLADLCAPSVGIQTGPFGSQLHQKDYVTVGTPIVTVEHLGENRILHTALPHVSDQDRSRLSKYSLQEGDIVFSRVGSVDRRGLVRKEEEGWLFSGRSLRIRPDPYKIDAGFLSYFFGLPAFKNHIRSIAVGATMPSLNTRLLSDIRVCHPVDIGEQRAIAHILGTLDDKIELNRQMNETLEAMARALFKSWFVDFEPVRAKMEDRDTGLPKEVAALFPDRLVDSELGGIPDGWKLARLDKIANATKGRSYRRREFAASDAALVTLKSFARGGGYRPGGLKPFRGVYKEEQVVQPGEVIVACTDVTQAAEVVGRSAVVGTTSSFRTLVASLDVLIVRPKNAGAGRAFVYYLTGTEDFVAHAVARTTGTTVLHLSKDAVTSFRFALPPRTLVKRFTQYADPLRSRIHVNESAVASLTHLRDTLLPKLVSGEIRVRDAEKIVGGLA